MKTIGVCLLLLTQVLVFKCMQTKQKKKIISMNHIDSINMKRYTL